MSGEQAGVRTFLIADVRGYSRFTEEFGDEAAARLAATFAEVTADEIDAHGGRVIEIRGDEALAVFTSARQAIRAGVDLQARFDEEESNTDLPLRVGIGIESGAAVELADRPRKRQRPCKSHPLVAAVASPDRQGRLTRSHRRLSVQ